jgi:hypothetical protein
MRWYPQWRTQYCTEIGISKAIHEKVIVRSTVVSFMS